MTVRSATRLMIVLLAGQLLVSQFLIGQLRAQTIACRVGCDAGFWQNTPPGTVFSLLRTRVLDPQARDQDLRTPLHWAAVFGDRGSIILILNTRATPDVRDLQGTTPLHLAAQFATDAETTQALLDAGAKVQARDQFGDTPLHRAARWSQSETLIEELLLAGANIWLLDSFGRSACQSLQDNPHHERLTMLSERCGGQIPPAEPLSWSIFEELPEWLADPSLYP